ncbi:hypothetical protein [Methanosarcina sp. 2.H.A.1B.4]|uniref:hypothetical protein n=1 Tax=Methanosarcina sp. 2.H.A.1B.4 TaxID=1483600 RepID=UPI0012E05B29|nr:hypothetical protein [Methanosarcina sp. 2.H.A.1B.4]
MKKKTSCSGTKFLLAVTGKGRERRRRGREGKEGKERERKGNLLRKLQFQT